MSGYAWNMETSSTTDLIAVGKRARIAAARIADACGADRTRAIHGAADFLQKAEEQVMSANHSDLLLASEGGLTPAQLDRLRLTPERFAAMVEGMHNVADLSDVVGEIAEGYVLANGLKVSRVRVPLGVVGIIYENRPNVTSDSASLCLKSGNAVMLRGSSHAIASNKAIAGALRQGIAVGGLPTDAVTLVEDTSREGAVAFMGLTGLIDCLIPRGGSSLIRSVRENSTVPTIIDGDGNCHIYVDASADLAMAGAILANAKLQRPGVCNAAESLLIHQEVAERFLSGLTAMLPGVEIRGDDATLSVIPTAVRATDEDYGSEFLDLIISVRVVRSLDEAISHIAKYSSGHSEAIITTDYRAAETFKRRVDAAAVLVNASTRFVDGGELGLGAEIGISTQKLHARGPMGLRALTTLKYVIEGNGQIRG